MFKRLSSPMKQGRTSPQPQDSQSLARRSWLGFLTRASNCLTDVFFFRIRDYKWFECEMSAKGTHRQRTFGPQLVAVFLEGCGNLSKGSLAGGSGLLGKNLYSPALLLTYTLLPVLRSNMTLHPALLPHDFPPW